MTTIDAAMHAAESVKFMLGESYGRLLDVAKKYLCGTAARTDLRAALDGAVASKQEFAGNQLVQSALNAAHTAAHAVAVAALAPSDDCEFDDGRCLAVREALLAAKFAAEAINSAGIADGTSYANCMALWPDSAVPA